MNVVVAGASGLIGAALVSALRTDGVRVTTLVRREPRLPDERTWEPRRTPLDPAVLADADAVVGLNGASIGRLPWTRAYQRELHDSRLMPTRTLVAALLALGERAPRFISASAVGYYGSAPGKRLTEESPPGDTFLARLCVEWEEAALAASNTEVTLLRTAPVMARGGVLAPLLRIAALGLAGPIGPGTQVWPWISLTDVVRALLHILDARTSDAGPPSLGPPVGLVGPVNLVGPTPATAAETVLAVSRRLGRPYWLRAPAWGLRLALGQNAADSLLLTDADVRPSQLEASGFEFHYPTVEAAVAAALA